MRDTPLLVDSYRRVMSSSQRPAPDKTQLSQKRNIHVNTRIWTHSSRWASTRLRLRQHGHWDWQNPNFTFLNFAFSRISFIF